CFRGQLLSQPPVKRPLDLVQLAQFSGKKRFYAIVGHGDAQFAFRVDAPGVSPAIPTRQPSSAQPTVTAGSSSGVTGSWNASLALLPAEKPGSRSFSRVSRRKWAASG